MPDHVFPLNQSATLIIMLLLACWLQPSVTLCETRCEQSIPSLTRLRQLWATSYRNVRGQQISFETFLLTLLQANNTREDLTRQNLRSALLHIIGRYQDCVMTCEHMFSKRSGRSQRRLTDHRRTVSGSSSLPSRRHFHFKRPVFFSENNRQISHVNSHKLRSYCCD